MDRSKWEYKKLGEVCISLEWILAFTKKMSLFMSPRENFFYFFFFFPQFFPVKKPGLKHFEPRKCNILFFFCWGGVHVV